MKIFCQDIPLVKTLIPYASSADIREYPILKIFHPIQFIQNAKISMNQFRVGIVEWKSLDVTAFEVQ